jgi:surface polysaccharide O-acyltransferase-like enzyme
MKAMKGNNHFVWADIVRTLAIFLVVYIHSRQNFETSPFKSIFSIFHLSSAICISLFVLLSGALLLSKHETASIFIRKRVMKICIPWIFWTVVWFIFEYHILQIPTHNVLLATRVFFRFFFSRFWFLPIIFYMYLFTPILRLYLIKLTTKALSILLVLWFFLLILFPTFILYHGIYNPSNTILTVFQFLGIYILGYLITNRYKPSGYIFLWPGLFFIGIIIAFAELLLIPNLTVARFGAFPYSFISPELLMASIGTFTTIYVLFNEKPKLYLNPSIIKVLSNISQAALGIYLTHEFFILLYNNLAIPTFFPFEETILVFSISCLFIVLLSKIPYIKLLVM